MIITERLGITLLCVVPVGVLGVGLSALSIGSFFNEPSLTDIAVFVAAVLFAPPVLLFEWWSRGAMSPETASAALVAVAGLPMHAIVARPWAIGFTILGAFAWFFCELIVAAAPA